MNASLNASPPRAERPFVDLESLRRQIRAIEGGAALRGRVSLGAAELDRALPGGGLARGALHEVAPAAHFDTPAAYAFLLGLAARAALAHPGEIVWVRGRGDGFGRAHGAGLAGFGLDPGRLLLVETRTVCDTLWAAEEAARTSGLAAVVAEPGVALDLAATRRLQLAAEDAGAALFLWRPREAAPITAARTRWSLAAAPSAAPAWTRNLPLSVPLAILPPGAPTWRASLVRARGQGRLRDFLLEWRHETREFHLASLLADRSAAQAGGRAAA